MTETSSTDDISLLDRWRAGDKRAGATLVSRYFPLLMRFFRNKVSNVDDAKDLVGETMLACTQGKETIRNDDFRKYLFGIALNKLRGHYRKSVKRKREINDFTELCVAEFDGPATPATIASRQREVRLLARALRRLPLAQQIVLELNFFEGERAPQIAEILGVPEQTVYTRLRRGKLRLADVMRELAEDPRTAESTLVGLKTWANQIRDQLGATG